MERPADRVRLRANRWNWLKCAALAAGSLVPASVSGWSAEPAERVEMVAAPCADFDVTGRGDASAWGKVDWTSLVPRGSQRTDRTRVKVLYSERGIYVLLDADDKRLTATFREDYAQLWREDVMEVFLWPDERHSIYFEYEISPLGYELPLLVPNLDGHFLGWIPWEYRGVRKIQKQVTIREGEQASGAKIAGWRAEVFIPYALLAPLQNVPPKPGGTWRVNFYRMDYDDGQAASWDWARVGPSFHEFHKFGTLRFQ